LLPSRGAHAPPRAPFPKARAVLNVFIINGSLPALTLL